MVVGVVGWGWSWWSPGVGGRTVWMVWMVGVVGLFGVVGVVRMVGVFGVIGVFQKSKVAVSE